jgi:hypothetical protein
MPRAWIAFLATASLLSCPALAVARAPAASSDFSEKVLIDRDKATVIELTQWRHAPHGVGVGCPGCQQRPLLSNAHAWVIEHFEA